MSDSVLSYNLSVQELHFPEADAANTRDHEQISFLHSVFLKQPASEQLILEQRYFIVGEKGTGKTALAIDLVNSPIEQLSAEILSLERNDFYSFLDWTRNLQQIDLDQSETWECILMIVSFVNLYNLQGRTDADSDDPKTSTLYHLLARQTRTAEPFRFNELFDLLSWNRDRFYHELQSAFPDQLTREMPPFYRDYLRLIKTFFLDLLILLRPLAYHNLLFVDGLDSFSSLVPGSRSSATADERMQCTSNLVMAVWNLNTRVFTEDIRKRLRVVLLIRPEIYDRAGILNKNNVITDHGIFLNWYTPNNRYRYSNLFHLACNILDSQQTKNRDVSTDVPIENCNIWDEYFPGAVNFGDGIRESFVIFLRFSFYRPRDIIRTLQILRQAMIDFKRGESTIFDVNLFLNDEVHEALCDYLLGEASEAAAFYYNVNDSEILTTFLVFLAQETGGHPYFSFDDFAKAFKLFTESRSGQKNTSPAVIDTSDKFLQFLFELNIVGFWAKERRTGTASREKWIFSFQQRSPNKIRPKVMLNTKYVIHRGFARHLLEQGN